MANMQDIPDGGVKKERDTDYKDPKAAKSFLALTKAAGIMTIHIKQCKLLNIDVENLFQSMDCSVYVRVSVGSTSMSSSAQDNIDRPRRLPFDDIRHFVLQVSTNRNDTSNRVLLELVAFDDITKPHKVIGRKELHLYDIIKHLYMVEDYEMSRLDKVAGNLEVEFCFAYGMFGYGYSNQLENRQKTAAEMISHSLFVRAEPDPGRMQEKEGHVTQCVHVGHPKFIPFGNEAHIGTTAREFGSDLSLHNVAKIPEITLLKAKIRKRINVLRENYAEHKTRHSRLRYLKSLLHQTISPVGYSDEFEIDDNCHMKHQGPGSQKRRYKHASRKQAMASGDDDEDSPAVPRSKTERREELSELQEVLAMAPGLQTRSDRRRSSAIPALMQQPGKTDEDGTTPILRQRHVHIEEVVETEEGKEEEEEEEKDDFIELPSVTTGSPLAEKAETKVDVIEAPEEEVPVEEERETISRLATDSMPRTQESQDTIEEPRRRSRATSLISSIRRLSMSVTRGAQSEESLNSLGAPKKKERKLSIMERVLGVFKEEEIDNRAPPPRIMLTPPTPIASMDSIVGYDSDDEDYY